MTLERPLSRLLTALLATADCECRRQAANNPEQLAPRQPTRASNPGSIWVPFRSENIWGVDSSSFECFPEGDRDPPQGGKMSEPEAAWTTGAAGPARGCAAASRWE